MLHDVEKKNELCRKVIRCKKKMIQLRRKFTVVERRPDEEIDMVSMA